ncbi:MAG: hypothetical protein ACRDPY_09700 [Streptosporangiaceae bacterium]
MTYEPRHQPPFTPQPPGDPVTYGAPPPPKPPESTAADLQMAKLVEYARQTRSATVFIAWIIGIGVAIALVLGIIVGVQTAKVANELNGGGGTSNCLSQGGTNPNC